MSHKPLALKWRPKKFQEVVGQLHITKSFQNSIINNRVNAAYLLTGTRGVGKTSLARIFSKALCCLNPVKDGNPCCSCEHCQSIDHDSFLDVIEIDGASNNSVENVRQLIENVKFVPIKAKYKIYIIDEVHMLSISAFNALLKTLEEPPPHVIFILATTEIDKLPDTVVSRCQRFDLKLVPIELLCAQVKMIASSEGVEFESDQVIEQICNQGRGSVRDTLSTLEQVFSFCENKIVTLNDISSILGVANNQTIIALVDNIISGKQKKCSQIYRELIRENIEVSSIVRSILDHVFKLIEYFDDKMMLTKMKLLSNSLIAKLTIDELFWIYETLAQDASWILSSIDPVRVTEVTLQKITLRRTILGSSSVTLSSPVEPLALEQGPAGETESVIKKKEEMTEEKIENSNTVCNEKPTWDGFLKFLRSKTITMASNLEQGNLTKPEEEVGGVLKITIGFDSAATVFLEYLQDKEVIDRLKNEASTFYNYSVNNIHIELVSLDGDQKHELNFQSKVDLYHAEEEKRRQDREQEFLRLDTVSSAEKIFNTKIDKIIVNMDK